MSVAQEQFALMRERRHNALSLMFFLCAAFAFLLRATISPQLMNMVVPYSTDGGSLPEKLHPGTYAIFLLLAAIFITQPILLKG
ncbi:MAG: hypothetical protein WBA88_27015, partial [Pseudaminobacter sp.]